ncbi:MAG: hypothetical protein RMI79_00375 [Nitrososphaerota archaeon]|nr:hypothetical protein [Nitrososphaerota archaeon]
MENKDLGFLSFEKIALAIIVLFVLITLSLPLIILTLPDANVQNINIRVKVMMKNGNTAMYPYVQIFHLTENGPSLIAGGPSDQNGLYTSRITIPRIWKNKLYVSESSELDRKAVDVYAAANILVIAYDEKYGLAGSRAFSLDPTYIKWPTDSLNVEVILTDELPKTLGVSEKIGVLSVPSPVETWQFTNVVEYAVWDQIWAYAEFPQGTKIDVEMKQRVYDPQTNQYLTDWISSGSTTITLDRGFGLPTITGKQKFTEKFKFKYILCYISIPYTPYYYETVYAVDTPDKDPIENENIWSSWSGSVSGSDPYITGQNTPWTEIPITQASQWAFTVTVSFGVSFPPGSVSISLGVIRYSIPYGKVRIMTGTWAQGYKVFTYGREYGFRRSYSVWRYAGP